MVDQVIKVNAVQYGKSEAMKRQLAQHLIKNPDATIAWWGPTGTRIEKPVKGEVVEDV
jgi:hypothetical protein